MIILYNDQVTVQIAKHGAELKSVKDNVTNIEYMWQANPEYWGRTAPILFPIVGKLVDDTYYVDGNTYHMGQHGFARDFEFVCSKSTSEQATFEFKSNEQTHELYPYEFILQVTYTLVANRVSVAWMVTNPMNEILPFAIGAHPAFNLNLFDADTVEDFYFEFDHEIHMETQMLEHGSFNHTVKSLGISDSLKLDAELFKNDALVFKDSNLQSIALKNMKNNHAITMDLSEFSSPEMSMTLGIWSPYRDGGIAPFVCIEPWHGYADTIDGPFELREKPGIIQLNAQQDFQAKYTLIFD